MLSHATRRTAMARIAGFAALAGLVPAARVMAAPADALQASDPALAAEIRALIAAIKAAYVDAGTIEAPGNAEDETMAHICLQEDYLVELSRRLWSTPPRTLGDLVVRADLARFWVSEERDGKLVWCERGDALERSAGELIEAVLHLARAPM